MSENNKTVAEQIAVLQVYQQVKELHTCHILHLYDTGVNAADNDGYVDSRFFDLWAYNTDTKQKTFLGRHDGCTFERGVWVRKTRIFADGSTMIIFKSAVKIGWGQDIEFEPLD